MDFISENWPWLAALASIFIKLVQDHLMIKQHESRLDKLDSVAETQAQIAATQTADIKHIKVAVDKIEQRTATLDQDIKDILRSQGNG